MKKILIAGAGSYIGVSFANYMTQWPECYQVDTLDVIGDGWKQADIRGYDVMFLVAGIAHQKETEENAPLYYQVNRDLAVELAKKAKGSGVPHFVFMSSMSVYGMDSGVITPDTRPAPKSHYGKSKLEAEQAMEKLADDTFRIAVLRPPMVYGKGCRGNFQLMLKLAKKSPVFPVVNNQRSMISIENLCAFVRLVIDRQESGVFFPQNQEYVNTTDMVRMMAKILNRRIFFSRLAGWAVGAMVPVVGVARKAFSSLIYQDCEKHDFCYCEDDFAQSMGKSL
jgi:UDP-glucose 4-epimerase